MHITTWAHNTNKINIMIIMWHGKLNAVVKNANEYIKLVSNSILANVKIKQPRNISVHFQKYKIQDNVPREYMPNNEMSCIIFRFLSIIRWNRTDTFAHDYSTLPIIKCQARNTKPLSDREIEISNRVNFFLKIRGDFYSGHWAGEEEELKNKTWIFVNR